MLSSAVGVEAYKDNTLNNSGADQFLRLTALLARVHFA